MSEKMKHYFCHKYGLDTAGREQRLDLLQLHASDLDLAQKLQKEIISSQIDRLVDEFYDYVLSQEQMVNLLKGVDIRQRMETQKYYIESLGIDFNTSGYFDERLRVGLAHAQAQIPLPIYECAFYYMQEMLFHAIELADGLTSIEKNRLQQFVRKITFLDMSLATDTYIRINVEVLKESITTLRTETQKLSSKVNIDVLTELNSREYIFKQAEKLLLEARNTDQDFSVILIDIDHFKQINDSHGHVGGDAVLKSVAVRLKETLRDIDFIGRIGGEEFMVLLPKADEMIAAQVSERIRQVVANNPVTFNDTLIDITISLGYAQAKKDKLSTLIERADKALYQSKHGGRNRVSPG